MKKKMLSLGIAFLMLIPGCFISAAENRVLYFDLSSHQSMVSCVEKNNTVTLVNNEIHVARTANTNDCYAEITMPASFAYAEQFTLEFSVKGDTVKSGMRLFQANLYSGSSFNLFGINNYGQIVLNTADGTKIIKLNSTYQSIKLSVDKAQKKAVVYSGGNRYEVALAIDSGFMIKNFRIGTNADGNDNDFFVKDIKIYAGSVPAEDTTQFSAVGYEPYSVMDGKDGTLKAQSVLGDSVVFSEKTFYQGFQKRKCSEAFSQQPYYNGSVLMIPADALSTLGAEAENSGEEITVNGSALVSVSKNGTDFLSLRDVCSALGLYLYEDERGYCVVGQSDLGLSDSANKYEYNEASDLIYRYLTFDRPSGETVVSLAGSAQHGQLLVSSKRLQTLKSNLDSDNYKAFKAVTLREADALLSAGSVEYEKPDGLRIIEACETVRDRLLVLSAAYLITEEEAYRSKIWTELESCLSWPDWNTSNHFLDSGMIGIGVAVAYDTIYNTLTAEQKQFVQDKLFELYLDFSAAAYGGDYSGSEFRYSAGNWGAVCPGSILSVCLALATDVTGERLETVEYLIENAMHSLEYPMASLFPDGTCDEGGGYALFIGNYLTNCVGMLENLCGTSYGFLEVEGFGNVYNYVLELNTNTGIYNFGNQSASGRLLTSPFAYRQALLRQDSETMSFQKKIRELNSADIHPLDILWYDPQLCQSSSVPEKDKYYSNGLTIMRNSYENKGTALAAAKGGSHNPDIDHLDKGSFIFETEGVRWAIDLGRDNYNMASGYFGEKGYTVYRKRTEGHNCLVIAPRSDFPGQVPKAGTELVKKDSSAGSAYVIYDLTEVYGEDVLDYKRGFYFGDNRESLIIRDELTLSEPNTVYWFMHTDAEIVISSDGKSAMLCKEGRQLLVSGICSAENWHFEKRDTTPFDSSMIYADEYSREGISKLTMVIEGSGELSVDVKLASLGNEKHLAVPLASWSCTEKVVQAPVINITRGNSAIQLHLNKAFTGESAYIAEYSIQDNKERLASVQTVRLAGRKSLEIAEDKHTKIFFWNSDLMPLYRYYEFNKEW